MSRPPDEPDLGNEPPDRPDRQDEPGGAGTGSPAPAGRPEPPPPPPYSQAPPPWSYQQAPPQAPPGMPAPFPPRPAPGGALPEPPPDRDRLAVHLVWEGVLAVVTLVLVAGTLAMTPHQNLTLSLGQAGALGLVAVGLSFSLRTGSPNLAVGAILTFSSSLGAHLATQQGWGTPAALIVAVLLATFIGLVLGLLVALLSVPAWAVTLAAATLIQSLALWVTDARTIPLRIGDGYPTALWFGLFAVLSLGGGALWLVPAVRGPLSAGRRSVEPGRWAGLQPGLGAVAGLTGSSFLAGLAAIPLLMRLQAADVGVGQNLTVVAFAAVLLGGASVFGRRAGVAGTLLGVMILTITQTLLAYNGVSVWVSSLIVGLLALTGLGVSRALESVTDTLNRPRPAPGAPPAAPPAPSAAG